MTLLSPLVEFPVPGKSAKITIPQPTNLFLLFLIFLRIYHPFQWTQRLVKNGKWNSHLMQYEERNFNRFISGVKKSNFLFTECMLIQLLKPRVDVAMHLVNVERVKHILNIPDTRNSLDKNNRTFWYSDFPKPKTSCQF